MTRFARAAKRLPSAFLPGKVPGDTAKRPGEGPPVRPDGPRPNRSREQWNPALWQPA